MSYGSGESVTCLPLDLLELCLRFVQTANRARQLREFIQRLEGDIEELDKEIERETAELKRIDTEGFSLTDITGETPETIGGRDA